MARSTHPAPRFGLGKTAGAVLGRLGRLARASGSRSAQRESILARKNAGTWCRTENRADRYASGAGPCCVRHTRRCAFVSGRRQARSWGDWGSWRGLPVPGLLSGNPSWRGKTPGHGAGPRTRLTAARAEQALGAFDTPGPALWSREDGRRGPGATGEAGAGFRLPVCSAGIHPGAEKRRGMVPNRKQG